MNYITYNSKLNRGSLIAPSKNHKEKDNNVKRAVKNNNGYNGRTCEQSY